MAKVEFKGHAAADPQTVWEIVADHVGMSGWTPIRSVTLEREGNPAPNGVGAIRAIRAIGPVLREEITTFDPPSRLGYTLLSGAPVRNYHAQVVLGPSDSGTDITWSVSFEPRLPGVRLVVSRTIASLVKGLVAEAERRA
jgi:uncharacterized protein YndB with AHSA1/START domain